ncbi:unnamed protein product [Hymenolepis diminuta]|uniref:Secreted protein n=1 Tax=Hymenolepis diminuta TaxID=6216 RepID=A0A564Y4R3_HYMDI|nr:unnamed protein product [Hymenolepis diminuta]
MFTHTHARAQTHASHSLLLRFSLIAFVPYLSLTRLNPHCGLTNTFWPDQFLVFCSKTVVSPCNVQQIKEGSKMQ